MKVWEILKQTRGLLPEEMQDDTPEFQPTPKDPKVLWEETPGSLDLGWYYSDEKNEVQMVKVALADRATHMYVIGATGAGKTKFLESLIQQDIVKGHGFGVIDPHGDLVEEIKGFLACVHPPDDQRLRTRVVVLDPTDPVYTVAFNPLEQLPGVSAAEQASELIAGFRKIWSDSWGPRMEDLLRNSLIGLGEAGMTLAELPAFLTRQEFRGRVLQRVQHPVALEYFHRFDAMTERARIPWIEPVMNKTNALLTNDRIRALFSSPKSSFQFRNVMDSGKILLVKLDKGRMQDTADLLGSLLLAKIKMAAFSRSNVSPAQRRPWTLYVDEFQNYASGSFGIMLSEARKYGLSLVMAHQTLAQVPPELRSLILGNTGIQVYFRVGHQDAQVLANEAMEYSGHEVKSAGRGGVRYWSLGEKRQLLTQELQSMPPRSCYVKHKIQGGVISIRTVNIEPPWELLGMDQGKYREYLASLPLGRKYLLERSNVEQGVAERVKSVVGLPGMQGDKTRKVSLENESRQQKRPSSEQPAADHVTERENGKLSEDSLNDVPHGTGKSQAPVYKELVVYLEHIAEHPFLPALQRDVALQLSRYKGGLIRQRLVQDGFIRLYKVGTGARSGQIVLQEITGVGYELLASMKIRVQKPKSRGGFLHKYYCYKLKAFAESTWPGSEVEIEDGSLGKFADVTVKMPVSSTEHQKRAFAFEVYMTGEAKEIRGIAKGVEVFDRVIVCADSRPALDSLKQKALETLGSGILEKVSFHLMSRYLTLVNHETQEGELNRSPSNPQTASSPKTASTNHENPRHQQLILLKSPAKLEPEAVPPSHPAIKRGRKPKTPLIVQIDEAYAHLHDLDYLQECQLAKLPEVKERVQPRHTMPGGQALRGLLSEAVLQVVKDIEDVPNMEGVKTFLVRHLEGKKISEIADELGVSREWCSRSYRKDGIKLASIQFVRSISREP